MELDAMELAYLAAVLGGTSVAKEAGKQSVMALKDKGLLNGACQLTATGKTIATFALDSGKAAFKLTLRG
jgi:hypothetical protein